MQELLNNLPFYSKWPKLLLSCGEKKLLKRSTRKTFKEYEKEKWGKLLRNLTKTGSFNIRAADKTFLGKKKSVYLLKNKIYKSNTFASRQSCNKSVFKILDNFNSKTFVELGAGYGSIILGYLKYRKKFIKNKNWIAYEFSQNALKILKKLDNQKKVISKFGDFTNPSSFSDIPKGSIIITHMSLMMIPIIKSRLIKKLLDTNPKMVLHFETIPEFCRSDLLGILQQKYIYFNDYNINLFKILHRFEEKKQIRIMQVKKNIYAENVLLPTSFVAWKPFQK